MARIFGPHTLRTTCCRFLTRIWAIFLTLLATFVGKRPEPWPHRLYVGCSWVERHGRHLDRWITSGLACRSFRPPLRHRHHSRTVISARVKHMKRGVDRKVGQGASSVEVHSRILKAWSDSGDVGHTFYCMWRNSISWYIEHRYWRQRKNCADKTVKNEHLKWTEVKMQQHVIQWW